MPEPAPRPLSPGPAAVFQTTHWSVVLQAAGGESAAAMEKLCRTYWYPLYAYARRKGHSREDAQDLTQGLFAHVLKGNFLENVGPQKSRFRSFLLAALNHFISDQSQA